MSALLKIRRTIDFCPGKIALHRPNMLSLKDAPSPVSAMWTAAVKGQSLSTVFCFTCGLTTGVFLQAHCSNSPIYRRLACSITSTGHIIPCWIFQSVACIITPGESSLFTKGKRRSGAGVHFREMHDITNKQPQKTGLGSLALPRALLDVSSALSSHYFL